MLKTEGIIRRAKQSKQGLWLFNRLMPWVIPFNLPHGLRVTHYGDEEVRTTLPLKFRNKNHLGGLHACALAVVAEYTSGLLLIGRLSPSQYRLIMRSLHIQYHRQGRTEGEAVIHLSENDLQHQVIQPLNSGEEQVNLKCDVSVKDRQGEDLCTATMHWQIKRWDKVRSK